MNQIIVNSLEFSSTNLGHPLRFAKDDPRYTHLSSILKVQIGDYVRISILDYGLGKAQIVTHDEQGIELRLPRADELQRPQHSFSQHPVYLAVGLSRPPTMKKIFEHTSTMGVAGIFIFKTDLSDKSYLQSPLMRVENYTPLLDLGLSQSRNLYQRPFVEIFKDLPSLLKSSPFAKIEQTASKFMLQMNGQKNFSSYSPSANKDPLLIIIGSERGLSEKEEKIFIERDYQGIKVSESTLRVEMACYYALAQLELKLFAN